MQHADSGVTRAPDPLGSDARACSVQMNVGNTAAVFAPNLLRPERETLEHLADTAHSVNLVALMISNPQRIFQPTASPAEQLSARSGSSMHMGGFHSARGSVGDADCSGRYRLSSASTAGFDQDTVLDQTTPQQGGAAPTTGEAHAPTPKPWYYLNSNHEQQGPVEDCRCRVWGHVRRGPGLQGLGLE